MTTGFVPRRFPSRLIRTRADAHARIWVDPPRGGAGQTLKRGTLIKSIRLTDDPQEIDCKFQGIKGLVLRAEFVRKR